ncbi:porin family protein [Adhaeribacter radiodurans]|uniref:PorT family protein n=1 Tax=Adhaeribacter radiodurans TaxID=2745197 RepID=A0A7L7LAB9_9BACT|nr:porin family protein [Adhaeribacter radiodurans]QMU29778.1 PorT family protein [Adhaeribacter radiodurans]
MLYNYYFRKLAGIGFAILLLIGSSQVKAQNSNPGPKFGVKAGLNFSQLYVDQANAQDENIKAGYHFGVFGKVPINDFLAIQPEVLYSNVGSKITYGGSDVADVLGIEPGEVRFNLNYVQVPIALAVNIGPLNVHAGPYFSYLVSANVKDLKSSDFNSSDITDLKTDNFNRFDYGVMGGIGFDVKGVTVGARYNYGLREVGNSGLAGNLTDNSKNSVAQIYLGFGL